MRYDFVWAVPAILFAVLTFSSILTAKNVQPRETAQPCAMERNPYPEDDLSDFEFFAIRTPKGTTRGYLLGSIHNRWGTFQQLPPAMKKAFDHATEIVFEILPDEPYPPKNGSRTTFEIRQLPGPSGPFSDLLEACKKKTGIMSWSVLPVELAVDLALYCRSRVDSENAHPVDLDDSCTIEHALEQQGGQDHKWVSGIETMTDRGRMIEHELGPRLPYFLDRFAEFLAFDGELTSSPEALRARFPLVSEFLLDRRNALWLPRLIKKMSGQRPLFVFGAAHLPGEKGLISLLEAEGFRIEPIETGASPSG